MAKSRARVVGLIVFVAVVLVFVGIPLSRILFPGEQAEEQRPPTPVRVTTVTRGLAERTVEYPATLSPETTTPVLSKVSGRLTSVQVTENQFVEAGQVIATVEDEVLALQVRQAEAALRAAQAQYREALGGARDTELEIARAELAQAETALETARGNLERTERLFEAGTVPRSDFEEAQDSFQAAETQVQNARRRLNLMEEGASDNQLDAALANVEAAQRQLELAQLQLSFARITAPVSGTVARVMVEEGQSVGTQTTLVALVNDELIFATAAVPERLYGRFLGRDGEMQARVVPSAYEDEPPFAGTVSSVASIIDSASRTFPVEVAIENDDGRLRPGMFVTVRFVLESNPEALLVQDEAIYDRDGQPVVFVIEEGVAQVVPVSVADLSGPTDEITGGLDEGAQVIAEGGAFLSAGRPVRVVNP